MLTKTKIILAVFAFIFIVSNFATYFFTSLLLSTNSPPQPLYILNDPSVILRLKKVGNIFHFADDNNLSYKIYIRSSNVDLDQLIEQKVNFKGDWQDRRSSSTIETKTQCIRGVCRPIFENKEILTNGVDISEIWVYDPSRPGNVKAK